jgi:hypothetical protein
MRLDELPVSTTPLADTDIIPTVENVSTTHNHKSKAWSVFKSTLKTYFDTIYTTLAQVKTTISAEIFISAVGLSPQATDGCAPLATTTMGAGKPDVRTLDFSASAIEYAQSSVFYMPSDYDGGTFTYKVQWKHSDTSTDFKVVWKLDAVAFVDGDTLVASFGTPVKVIDTGGTTNDYYTTPESTAVIPAGTPDHDCGIIMRISRTSVGDADDTMGIDAGLIGIQITYTRA